MIYKKKSTSPMLEWENYCEIVNGKYRGFHGNSWGYWETLHPDTVRLRIDPNFDETDLTAEEITFIEKL